MKRKLFFYSCLLLALASCDNDNDWRCKANIVGFEGSSWSSYIDSPQYGGQLLYGDMTTANYSWTDATTGLSSKLCSKLYWSGGIAISNYVDTVLTDADYTKQLSICVQDAKTGKGGHDGSENFAVVDVSDYGTDVNVFEGSLPYLYNEDGSLFSIDHLYIASTSYFMNVAKNGNSFSSAVTSKDSVYVKAVGFNADNQVTGSSIIYLIKAGKYKVTKWTKWNLSSLGTLAKVQFTMGGTTVNDYGFTLPAYFAIDDIAILKNDE